VRRSILVALLAFVAGLGCDSSEDEWVSMQMCEEKCEDMFDSCMCLGHTEFCDPAVSYDGCQSSDLFRCSPEAGQDPYGFTCHADRDMCLEKC